jgi:S1-C subfamily serine protease
MVANLNEAVGSSVTVKRQEGHGSGFIISEEGHIITNYHVVVGAEELTIIMNDGSKYPAEILRVSKVSDLALVKIEQNGLLPFSIGNQETYDIGSDVFAVGTPNTEDLSQTVSKGIISGIRKTELGSVVIQTDASVNSGNSGGALITPEGTVLGIVTAKLSGFGVEGVSFSIPSTEISERLKVTQHQ